MKKQSRRYFIKYKLWKGFLLSVFSPISTIANHDNLSFQNAAIFNENGTINWKNIKELFTLANTRKHFNTASIGPSPISVQEATIESIEVILTSEEHIGGSAPWISLQNEIGIKVTVIDILGKEEKVLDLLKSTITNQTKVISISHITCTTGTILPIRDIIQLCKKHQIQSVIDGTQALGQISVDIEKLQPDFYIASCHKWLFGPKGTGILYLNKDFLNDTPPLFAGAYTDQKFDLIKGIYTYKKHASRYEYGTINAPILNGLEASVTFIDNIGINHIEARGRQLASRFRTKITPNQKITILTSSEPSESASMVTFKIKDKNSSAVCGELRKNYNTILRSVTENNMNAIRASFAIYIDEHEVDELVDKVLTIANS